MLNTPSPLHQIYQMLLELAAESDESTNDESTNEKVTGAESGDFSKMESNCNHSQLDNTTFENDLQPALPNILR